MNRLRAIASRWLSMICCGLLAFVMWTLVGDPVQSLLNPIIAYLATVRPSFLAFSILITTVASCWPYGRFRWIAFFGLRHFWTYPPLWIAVAIGLLLITIYTGMTTNWGVVVEGFWATIWLIQKLPWWLWLAIGSLAVTYFIFNRMFSKSKRQGDSNNDNHASLKVWIHDDHEISNPLEDRFGHNLVALRIVKRLTESKGESPTMAIVGPLGSGKSTIRKLVEHHLTTHRSIQMLNLSLWPYDSAEAAVSGILRTVIQGLGRHVNTFAVTGLSERYVTAIERVGGRWGVLARFLRSDSRPEVILQSLAEISTAAGIKLVLWIEDMERFTGADRLPPEDAAIREAERLGPILSLLVLLDRCESISVIVGDTSLRSRLDVGKIARFIEKPPRLIPKLVWQEIKTLRSECLAEQFIDPASDKYRSELTPPEDDTQLSGWMWSINDTEPRVQEAIALLLETPRSLKWALRLTWETWDRLRGEIDFDSVLAASALRVARPDVFTLIEDNTDLFRYGFGEKHAVGNDAESQHPVHVQLDTLLKIESTERMQNAIKAVIGFVFPSALQSHVSDNAYVGCPQGLSVYRHADYWQRYLSLPEVTEDNSDQSALQDIDAWKKNEDNGLVSRLLIENQSAQIETFVGQFTAKDLCRLLMEVAEELREQSATGWEEGHRAPGITSVWRMMHKRTPPPEFLAKTLKQLIREITPHNLPLIHDIYYYFAAATGNVPQLLNEQARSEVDELLIETFLSSFPPGSAEQLLRAVRNGTPYILYWICWGIERIKANQNRGEPFDKWKNVADVLLDAAEFNPERGVSLIVPFVTNGDMKMQHQESDESGVSHRTTNFVAEFDEKAARQLFDFDRLIRLLSETERPAHVVGQFAVQYDAAREAALQITASKPDLPSPNGVDPTSTSPEAASQAPPAPDS